MVINLDIVSYIQHDYGLLCLLKDSFLILILINFQSQLWPVHEEELGLSDLVCVEGEEDDAEDDLDITAMMVVIDF